MHYYWWSRIKRVSVGFAMIFMLSFACLPAHSRVNCISGRGQSSIDKTVCRDAGLRVLDKKLDDEFKKTLKTPYVKKSGVLSYFKNWWDNVRPYENPVNKVVATSGQLRNNYLLMIDSLVLSREYSWKPIYEFVDNEDLAYVREGDAVCKDILNLLNNKKYKAPFAWNGLPINGANGYFSEARWRASDAIDRKMSGDWTYSVLDNIQEDRGLLINRAVNGGGQIFIFRNRDATLAIDGADIFFYKKETYSYVWSAMSPSLLIWRLDKNGEVLKGPYPDRTWCQIRTKDYIVGGS